jgi:four helix bundle protein
VKEEGRKNSYRDLIVWQKSMQLAKNIYRITAKFPENEKYGLISQLRRCAVLIPSNIAEGWGRGSYKEFNRFLQIALGSLYELQTQVELAVELEITAGIDEVGNSAHELEKMINSLITSKGGRDA